MTGAAFESQFQGHVTVSTASSWEHSVGKEHSTTAQTKTGKLTKSLELDVLVPERYKCTDLF